MKKREEFFRSIRRQRIELAWLRSEIADSAGVDPDRYGQFEKGNGELQPKELKRIKLVFAIAKRLAGPGRITEVTRQARRRNRTGVILREAKRLGTLG